MKADESQITAYPPRMNEVIIAYATVAASFLVIGVFLGWLIWAH